MGLSVSLRFLVICAGILSSAFLGVLGQGVPTEEKCTPTAIIGCYLKYYRVLEHHDLKPDDDGRLNNTVFDRVCNEVKMKSPCHRENEKCPQKAGMDLNRQERGYELLRDFVCDTEFFKDFQRAMPCEDYEKAVKCREPTPPEHEQPPFKPNSQRCRLTIDEWVCREESLGQPCSVPLSRAKAAYSKVRETMALLMGCDYKPSSASSLAPQGFLLCLITFYSLRWMRAL